MTQQAGDTGFAERWVVDADYTVLSVPEFDTKYSHYLVQGTRVSSPGLANALRAGRAHFDTEDQARAHAVKLLDMCLAECEAQAASLRARRMALTGTRALP